MLRRYIEQHNSPLNRQEKYLYVYDRGIRFNVVHYRDPEIRKLYRFVTTSPESINPGTIAMLYFKRWTIEKAYNSGTISTIR